MGQARSLPVYGGGIDVKQIRQSGLDFADGPLSYSVPLHIKREWVNTGTVHSCWFRREKDRAAPAVLYLHGGGYVGGSVEASRGIAASLAANLRAPVLVVNYRQGPEDPYPAGIEDIQAAYRWLLGETGQAVTIVGDSVGGAHAIGMARLTRQGADYAERVAQSR